MQAPSSTGYVFPMPSTPRPPYQLRRPGWIVPGLSLLMLFGLTISVHALLDPATRRLAFETSDFSAESMDPVEVARIGASARAWALSYLATIVGSVGMIAFGVTSAVRLAYAAERHPRRHRRAVHVLIVLIVLSMGMVGLVDYNLHALPPYWYWLQGVGPQAVLAVPFKDALVPQVALMGGAGASMFAAATCLMARVEEAVHHPDAVAELTGLRDQLQVLVLAGAIGTSLAVLNFATSHGLATAGLVHVDEAVRQAQVAAIDRMVTFETLYWGGTYTIGLLLLYLVPAATIAGALQRSAKEAPRQAREPASLQTWTVVLRPALGALTMAAPLVTGALSSLLAGALSP